MLVCTAWSGQLSRPLLLVSRPSNTSPESCRDEARPPGWDVGRAQRGGVGVRQAEPCDEEPGEPHGEDEPCSQGCPAMTLPEGAVQDHPRNCSGDPYERRKKQQSRAVGCCAVTDVASSPGPPNGSSGHHRGQPTEDEPKASSSQPAARRTRWLCSHDHLPRVAVDAEGTNVLKQPVGALACPDEAADPRTTDPRRVGEKTARSQGRAQARDSALLTEPLRRTPPTGTSVSPIPAGTPLGAGSPRFRRWS